jgi:hypothetical protein
MSDQAATELKLYIDNDGDLYRSQTTYILKNLATKKAQGKYEHELAVKAFGYLVDSGAKKYAKVFGSPNQPWNKMFSASTRRAVAEALTRAFEGEYALGNYDHLLPKKYQPQETAKKGARAHARKRDDAPKFNVGDIVRRTAARMRSMGLVSGPVNGVVVGYSGPWPLIRWSDMAESDEPMAQAEEGLELDKRAMSRRAHARRKTDLGTHMRLHEPDALRSATDRQLRGFYRDEQRDVASARAEAARRGVTLHARKRRTQLDREIASVVSSWRGGR